MHIVIAEWEQIYFAYDHLIIHTCCLGVPFIQNVMNFIHFKELGRALAFMSPFLKPRSTAFSV